MQQYIFPRPVYTKDLKDVPERVYQKWGREWLRTIDFNKLPKHQLKVKMCCAKCEEKVLEEIWEVRGVFDVIAYRADMKVVVTGMPEFAEAGPFGFQVTGRDGYLDPDEVLRKARKIDCKARFVKLDHRPAIDNGTHSETGSATGCGTGPKIKPDDKPKPSDLIMIQNVTSYPPSGYSPAYCPCRPPIICRDPAQDDNTPFYYLLFVIILLLSLLVIKK